MHLFIKSAHNLSKRGGNVPLRPHSALGGRTGRGLVPEGGGVHLARALGPTAGACFGRGGAQGRSWPPKPAFFTVRAPSRAHQTTAHAGPGSGWWLRGSGRGRGWVFSPTESMLGPQTSPSERVDVPLNLKIHFSEFINSDEFSHFFEF